MYPLNFELSPYCSVILLLWLMHSNTQKAVNVGLVVELLINSVLSYDSKLDSLDARDIDLAGK